MKWTEMQRKPLILTSLDEESNKSVIAEIDGSFLLTVHNHKEREIVKEYFAELEGAKQANLKKEIFIIRRIKQDWDSHATERSFLVLDAFKESGLYKGFAKKPYRFGQDSIQFIDLDKKESLKLGWEVKELSLIFSWSLVKGGKEHDGSQTLLINESDLAPLDWLLNEVKNLV